MTIEDVLRIVERETGQQVTAETRLSALALDSLEYVDLLIVLGVPVEKADTLESVGDLV